MKKANKRKYTFIIIALLIIIAIVAVVLYLKNKKQQALGALQQTLFLRPTNITIGNTKVNVMFSRYFQPYVDFKTGLHHALKNKTGVYIILNPKTKKIEYVGNSASDIYKTMYRHFQSWADPQQYRATFPKNGYLVRVILIDKPEHIYEIEKYYIRKHQPKANEDKYNDYNLEIINVNKIEENDWIKQIDTTPF
ncbi:MAG TPA: hypothetical protein DCS19_07410 [Flavobacterium sp.]|nr:hypothetical protein [Flavobacterium sp.]